MLNPNFRWWDGRLRFAGLEPHSDLRLKPTPQDFRQVLYLAPQETAEVPGKRHTGGLRRTPRVP